MTTSTLVRAYRLALEGKTSKQAAYSGYFREHSPQDIADSTSSLVTGALVGTPLGALLGWGRGNIAEGVGRGLVRGSMTGAGAGLGAYLGRAAGGQNPVYTGLGMGIGGLGGYLAGGDILGEAEGGHKKKREKEAATRKPRRPRLLMVIHHTRMVAHSPLEKLKSMARLPRPEPDGDDDADDMHFPLAALLGQGHGHCGCEEEESPREEAREEGQNLTENADDLRKTRGKSAAFSFEYDLIPDQAEFTMEVAASESPFVLGGPLSW